MGKNQAKAAERTAQSQENIANRTLDIGESLLKASEPARTTAQNYYTSIVSGGPGLDKVVAPQINAATRQYNAARRAISDMPTSGYRDKALSDMRLAEAGTKAGIMSGGIEEALARLASMGWMGTQSGVGAYGSASSGLGAAGQTYAKLSSAKGESAGNAAAGLGSVAGMFL